MTYRYWRNAAVTSIVIGSLALAGSALATALNVGLAHSKRQEVAKVEQQAPLQESATRSDMGGSGRRG